MRFARPAFSADPSRFGRRPVFVPGDAADADGISDDLRLFAMTFAGGFLFVSLLIA